MPTESRRSRWRRSPGADTVWVNDLADTDVALVDVDLGVASAGDLSTDTIEVRGTAGTNLIQASASGAVVQVTGLAAMVQLKNSEGGIDHLALQGLAGTDTLAGGPSPRSST